MKKRANVMLVMAHRALFVIATAILAIAASRVAADPGLIGAWISLVSSALVLYVADAMSDVDRTARDLALSAGKDLDEARFDVLEARGPKNAALLAFGGGIVMIGGLVADATFLSP